MPIYSVISTSGQAFFTNENGRVDFEGPQFRNYLITIDRNGFISGSDLGYYGTNKARFYLFNPFRYSIIVDYKDESDPMQYLGSDCSSPWFSVPWDQKGNFMTIKITPASVIKQYTGTNQIYNLKVDQEIKFRSAGGETVSPIGDVSLNISQQGTVTLNSITTSDEARLITVNNAYSVPYQLSLWNDQAQEYCLIGSLGTLPPFPLLFEEAELVVFNVSNSPCPSCPSGFECGIGASGIYECIAKACSGTICGTLCCGTNEICTITNGVPKCDSQIPGCDNKTCVGKCMGPCPEGHSCIDKDGHHCVKDDVDVPWHKSAWFIILMIVLSLLIVGIILWVFLKSKKKIPEVKSTSDIPKSSGESAKLTPEVVK